MNESNEDVEMLFLVVSYNIKRVYKSTSIIFNGLKWL